MNRSGSGSRDLTVTGGAPLSAKQEAARRPALSIGLPIPELLHADPSPGSDRVFDLLLSYHRSESKLAAVLSAITEAERRLLDVGTLDSGSLRRDAFVDLKRKLTTIEDGRSGNTEYRVVIAEPLPIVNEYELFEYDGVPFGVDLAREMTEIWNASCAEDLPYAEFAALADGELCTDWNKIDVLGDAFGGFWKSEDPSLVARAWDLTRAVNIWELYQLPFPKKLLMRAVAYGCSQRSESVRHANMYLVLFQRYAAVAGIPLAEYTFRDPGLPTHGTVVQDALRKGG